MKYLVAGVACVFLAMLNVSAMPYVKVLGVTPDLVLIFAACWAVIRGQDEAMYVVPMAGFARDFATADPLGTSVLALIPVVLLAAVVRVQALDSDFIPTVAVVAAGSVCYSIVSSTVLGASGQEIDWWHTATRLVVPAAVVNALFTPIVYLPVHWLSPSTKATVMGPGRITSPL